MQEQFKNIFVTLEVAKMAKEKGFNEWCAAYYDIQDDNEICANVVPYDKSWCEHEMSDHIAVPAPTYFQLTEWLREKYWLDIYFGRFDAWYIDNSQSVQIGEFKNINDALIEALKLVEHE